MKDRKGSRGIKNELEGKRKGIEKKKIDEKRRVEDTEEGKKYIQVEE